MILGARESSRSLLYNESKNIENRRVLFAGDGFENLFFAHLFFAHFFCWFIFV